MENTAETSTHKPKIVSIVGPTASGKTSLSIEIAKLYNGEVISVDSRQVYKGLDIGTGKVTKDEMQGVPHHLVDVVDINTTYTGNDFVRDATAAIQDILNRGRLPVLVGGTFFYLDLLRGKTNSAPVPANQELRNKLENKSVTELFDELEAKDPSRAASIDENNKRRLIRALEIISTLGAVPETITADSPYNLLLIGLTVEKETLQENFKKRLQHWINQGFKNEVRGLIDQKIKKEKLAELGFEYELMVSRILGEISDSELQQKFIEKNWQYAKRQLTWLKRDEEIEWFVPENREAIFRQVDAFLNT